MKKFDLNAARRGAAVCTTDDRDVAIVGISDVTGTICGYVGPNNTHDLWALDGSHAFEESRCLMMCDDDYEERLARGEYQVPDGGFIREARADQELPKEQMGCTEAAQGVDYAQMLALVSSFFGQALTAPTRLRINIEVEVIPAMPNLSGALTAINGRPAVGLAREPSNQEG